MSEPCAGQQAGHAFVPRMQRVTVLAAGLYDRSAADLRRDMTRYPPNPHLCEVCGLAEAAHEATTSG
jgi:hypothetical protein